MKTKALVVTFTLLALSVAAAPARAEALDAACGGSYGLFAAADGEPPQAVLGDLNGDGHVDVIDLLIFVDTFGKMLGDPGFNGEADFNCDGSIDVIDLLTFVPNFGT